MGLAKGALSLLWDSEPPILQPIPDGIECDGAGRQVAIVGMECQCQTGLAKGTLSMLWDSEPPSCNQSQMGLSRGRGAAGAYGRL